MITTLLFLLLAQVRGVVSDSTGRPIEGAQVACGSETKSTDSHGAVEFANACQAKVSKPGFTEQTAALTEKGDTQVTLQIAAASETVVVTATGSPVALEEAGVAADVFTAKDFSPARGSTVENLLRDVPGISVAQTGNSGAVTSVFTRGGQSYTTLVLLDGVPLTDPGGQLDLIHLTSA